MIKSDYYSLYPNSDGTWDVYLVPDPGGKVYIVRGIADGKGLEEKLRWQYGEYLKDAKNEEEI